MFPISFGPQFYLKIWGAPPPPASPLDRPLVCFFNDDKIGLDVRESKIVIDSGFYVVDSDARC